MHFSVVLLNSYIFLLYYLIDVFYLVVCWDVGSAASSSSEAELQLMDFDISIVREVREQIVLSPFGIPFFNNNMHTLYTEGR